MAENKLAVPAFLYDYVLYHECAEKDWSNPSAKKSVKGDGSLMNAINWNSTSTTVPGDSGGATLFGVTHGTWSSYVNSHPNKGFNPVLNTMGQKGWLDLINEYFWDEWSNACRCANYACAMMLFQAAWGGFASANECLTALKNKKDKDYNFLKKGSIYKKIADATHAYNDPMKAYGVMRESLYNYIYNLSSPGRSKAQFRVGWMRRYVLAFRPSGLFLDDGISYSKKRSGLDDRSSLSDWDELAKGWETSNKSGYIKLFDWGATPEQIANMTISSSTSYNPNSAGGGTSGNPYNSSLYQSLISSDAKYGNVYKLGNYASQPDAEIEYKQSQNKDDVLNTLVNGAYEKEEIKKCVELISPDKKKNAKNKSEK